MIIHPHVAEENTLPTEILRQAQNEREEGLRLIDELRMRGKGGTLIVTSMISKYNLCIPNVVAATR